ncbi:riboflavin kinase [Ephemerocybe angulata]|uniref:Riboflavin kinase n=1 Tax=Ephemerocybe angulata TaxID=980116 RepID=A0A8H6ICI3_9AGAR|nr:riboflavin kinase [Tulosesus angulatus]
MSPPTALEVSQQEPEVRPAPVLRTETFRAGRPSIVGPDTPESPFPIFLAGKVQYGFGRGGKDLGCPTANLPDESITPMSSVANTGVYYGYAQVVSPPDAASEFSPEDLKVLPMVMSLGWNPFYKNEKLTAEIHIMHEFKKDFYGYEMRAIVLGYIRPELDYTSREALIDDIEFDKRVALNCLERPEYRKYEQDPYFTGGAPVDGTAQS